MANPEHLEILKQGVEVWNKWRIENPEIEPELSNVEFHSFAQQLTQEGEESQKIDLSGINLKNAKIEGSSFVNVILTKAKFTEAWLNNTNFLGAYLEDANFKRATLHNVTFTNACLDNTDFTGAHLTKAIMYEASFINANFSESSLSGADLTKAKLIGANLFDTDLSGADLSGADLSNTTLEDAELFNANLTNAKLNGANFLQARIGGTIFGNNDLSTVEGLDFMWHTGPSTIGLDTIYLSNGQIPESFLQDAGVPDDFLVHLRSLIAAVQPIQFYSCFISHSSKDEEFAKRLHSRMRGEHLRVWFAPEDIKGGQKLYEQIERAIQIHDRLLLILSENSMQSEWVITEIRRARKTEIEENRRKLFPIAIVDFDKIKLWNCFDADNGKDLAVEVREYFIPDFSNWKEHDAFEKAFYRLLRDLKANEKKA